VSVPEDMRGNALEVRSLDDALEPEADSAVSIQRPTALVYKHRGTVKGTPACEPVST
jgi:hypothetical protein